MKTLAVLLPTYNAALYIEESIDSILNQTFVDFDLFVYDDCSTDHTAGLVRNYTDDRVNYVKNDNNLGIAKTLNRGLDDLLPHYRFIARMDADDWAYPERFEKQLDCLERCEDVVLCGTQGYWLKDLEQEPISGWTYPLSAKYIKYNLLFGATFGHSSVIIRSAFLIHSGLRYDDTIKTCEDWDLWIRVIKHGKAVNLPEFLMKYRILDSSNHRSSENRENHLNERSKILAKYWLDFEIRMGAMEVYNFYYGDLSLGRKEFVEQSKKIIQAFNEIYNIAKVELEPEDQEMFRYKLARRIRDYWKRSRVSRFNILIWWHVVKSVTFMNSFKLVKSIIR
ncbi:glycosyltransferase family 2 protein [Flavisericum labens]|uniref:glycosyltransferase family 2 protein n=1 Tax=Flavisericum labens TaxID=3377112 RepID=UPI00387B8A47